YKDPDELDSEIGTWRAPNAAELSLMMQYLRSKDANGIPNDPKPSMFFANDNAREPQPFSSTSWNWAGGYWIRLVGIRKIDDGNYRTLYLSDPYQATFDSQGNVTAVGGNWIYDVANFGLRDAVDILLRCVKDVEKSEVPGY
nr:hypothetical protein [Bacteroidaceae bacterium]